MTATTFRNSSTIFSVIILLALSACGGGSGNSPASATTSGNGAPDSILSSSAGQLSAACNATTDANCGTVSASKYAGKGIGIWSTNATTSELSSTLSLSGVKGKTVTLIWTNTSPDMKAGPSSGGPGASVVKGKSGAGHLHEILEAEMAQIRKTMANPPSLPEATVRASAVKENYVIGTSSRKWYDAQTEATVRTTLRRVASLGNGQNLNIWVQDSEWTSSGEANKVSQAMIERLASKFATNDNSIFRLVTAIAGQPWGPTRYRNLIAADQDINIIVTNFEPDGLSGGVVGYFRGMNNILRASGDEYKTSNEALAFFVDSETLASNRSEDQDTIISVLAHEFTHMINFYQRFIRNGVDFDNWLEEISAMTMEDIVNPQIVSNFNDTLAMRFPGWLANGLNNCSLIEYQESGNCFSYDIGATYGAFLLRQYGLDFYKTLLTSNEHDSITALDKAIKASDSSSSFANSVQRWGAAIALLDSNMLPKGYGYPSRTVSVGAYTWTIPAINGPDYANYRRISPMLPHQLKAYAHAAQSFTQNHTTFTRKVKIPAGTALTVVVN